MTIRVAMLADHPLEGHAVDGGVQAVTSYLVAALGDSPDVNIDVISFQNGISEATTFDRRSFRHHIIPYAPLGTLTNFRVDQQRLDARLEDIRPHVIHSQGGGHQGVLASRAPVPSVVTIHGILSQEAKLLPTMRQRLRTRLQAAMADRVCIRGASHTILISPYVEEYYGSRLGGQRYLIPNPVAPEFFEIDRREERNEILFAGRIYALKGVLLLVSALAEIYRHDDIQSLKPRLVLAGSLTDVNYVEQVKAAISDAGLSHSVDFAGPLSPARYLDALARCTCLVLPSYQETAPMVIQEAMAAGVPVVASSVGGVPYQLTNGTTGLLTEPGSVKSLAAQLHRALTDDELRERLARSATVYAKENYLASQVAGRTIDVYRSIIQTEAR